MYFLFLNEFLPPTTDIKKFGTVRTTVSSEGVYTYVVRSKLLAKFICNSFSIMFYTNVGMRLILRALHLQLWLAQHTCYS